MLPITGVAVLIKGQLYVLITANNYRLSLPKVGGRDGKGSMVVFYL